MAKKKLDKKEKKQPFLSDRQKTVLLAMLVLMFIAVPVVDNFRCKSACLKRTKTPYPEIACKYQCPWPWQKQ
jgi:hypothetical protein